MRPLLTSMVLACVAWGAPQGKGKGKGNAGAPAVAAGVIVYRIPEPDVVIVREYYRGQALPPGLAKKLARGGSLPPGWQKKIQPVPVVLETRLAPLPPGYARGLLDGVFVVYDSNRGLIVDLVASF
jgi:hypothetical protein